MLAQASFRRGPSWGKSLGNLGADVAAIAGTWFIAELEHVMVVRGLQALGCGSVSHGGPEGVTYTEVVLAVQADCLSSWAEVCRYGLAEG